MQAVAQDEIPVTNSSHTFRLALSYQWVMVATLVVFSTIFHLAGLDEFPLSDAEAYRALSAWRSVVPHAAGDPIIADSPMVWWSQKIAFTLLGGSEFASRVLTALAGVLLSVSPLFFVPLLGKSRAYITAVLLSVSPILLASARMSSSTIWSLLCGVVVLWFVWRFYETGHKRYGLSAVIAIGFLLFMTESQAPLLFLMLIGAGAVALLLTLYMAFVDNSPSEIVTLIRQRLTSLSWIEAIAITGLIIFAIATGFLFASDGFKIVGELLTRFLRGFTQSQHPQAYRPLDVLIFYEVWLIPFFFLGVGLIVYQQRANFVERFLILWTVFGWLVLSLYPDMTPSHAVWLILPMSLIMAYVISQAFIRLSPPIDTSILVTDDRGLLWGKFTVAFITFVMFILLVAHLQFLSRGFLLLPNGTPSTFFANLDSPELIRQLQARRYIGLREALIVSVIVVVMMLVGYFLATTIWGMLVPLQGAVIGMFAFVWMASFGTAWSVGMHRASNPIEMFHYPQMTAQQAFLLRKTVQEIAFRYSGGTNALPIAVLAPDDGVVAWFLRDFYNTRYVKNIREAQFYEVIIMPFDNAQMRDSIDLGGDYVGQRFEIIDRWVGVSGIASNWRLVLNPRQVLRRPYQSLVWEINLDLMTWWLLREVRHKPRPVQSVVLWLRQDVYDNVPLSEPMSW